MNFYVCLKTCLFLHFTGIGTVSRRSYVCGGFHIPTAICKYDLGNFSNFCDFKTNSYVILTFLHWRQHNMHDFWPDLPQHVTYAFIVLPPQVKTQYLQM